jgi:hypothetical protein
MSIGSSNTTLNVNQQPKACCDGIGLFCVLAFCLLLASCGIHEGSKHQVFGKRKHLKGIYYYGLKRYHPPSEQLRSNASITQGVQLLSTDSISTLIPSKNVGLSYHYVADTNANILMNSELYKATISSSDSMQTSSADTITSIKDQIRKLEKKKKNLTNIGIALVITGGILSILRELIAAFWIELLIPLGTVAVLLIFLRVFKLSKRIEQLKFVLNPESKPLDAPVAPVQKPNKKRTAVVKAVFIPIVSLLLLASLVLTGYVIYELSGTSDDVGGVINALFLIMGLGMSLSLNAIFLTLLLLIILPKKSHKKSNK